MSAAKHTTGPWQAEPHSEGVEISGGDWYIADVYFTTDMSGTETHANARLMAAAPELLEALQRLLPAYREAVKLWDSNHDDAFTVQAHNAIAKATGSNA